MANKNTKFILFGTVFVVLSVILYLSFDGASLGLAGSGSESPVSSGSIQRSADGAGLNDGSTQAAHSGAAFKSKAELEKMPDPNAAVRNFGERMQKVSRWVRPNEFTEQELFAAASDSTLWDLTDAADADGLPLQDSEKFDGRQFFNANQARVAATLPGDVLEIALPDTSEKLELLVESVEVDANQLPSWKGRVINSNYAGTFNMIRGNDFVSGHINTDSNTYSFELIGKKGWVHESGALFTGEAPPVLPPDDMIDPVNDPQEKIPLGIQ